MTSRARMLTALHREKPDRLPVTLHQWQDYHLHEYMGGVEDIEAFRICGLDAAISVMATLPLETPQWREEISKTQRDGVLEIRHTIHTPKGVLTYTQQSNPATTWIADPLIKHPEDIYLLREYYPVPKLDRDAFFRKREALGDGGILRSFPCGLQGSCWQDACELVGTERMIYAAFDTPDWVHELLSILLEWKLRFVEENLSGLPVDLIETGGGAGSNTVISPSMHQEFCLPYDQKLHAAIHQAGLPVVYHTCGGMTKLPKLIVQNGCDASETLSGTGVGGDIATDAEAIALRDALLPSVALIGGFDQINILERGTPAMIRDEVRRLFHVFGPKGGYILSASDHFFEAPVENIQAYAQAAAECIY